MFKPAGKVPTLELPSWAVDNDILDRIEALILSVHEHIDRNKNTDSTTQQAMNGVEAMRHYINHGVWKLDTE